jgi:hypothetical protein
MPFCPQCKAEYTAGKKWCTDCAVALVDNLSDATDEQMTPGEQVRAAQVCEVNDSTTLEMIENQLHTAGIPTARQPKNIVIYVPEDKLDQARHVLSGEGGGARIFDTVGLSELNRIRLICSTCDQPTSVDLLTERVPAMCSCGHRFDLNEALPIIDRFAEVVRSMADKDFDIEVELPEELPMSEEE